MSDEDKYRDKVTILLVILLVVFTSLIVLSEMLS